MADYKKSNNSYNMDDKTKKSRRPAKKKICYYCNENKAVDYKDINSVSKFVTEKGKIIPSRATGMCAHHQRQITVAVKRARCMALLPFKGE